MAASLTLMYWEPNPSKEQKMLLITAPSPQFHALVFHDSSINRLPELRHLLQNKDTLFSIPTLKKRPSNTALFT